MLKLKQNMKKFRFTLKKLSLVLFVIIIISTVPAFVISILKMAGVLSSYLFILDLMTALLSLLVASITISVLAYSFYVFGKNTMSLRFGIIKQSIPYKKMISVKKLSESNTLWLIYTDDKDLQSYIMINVNEKYFDDFVAEIRLHNGNVIYSIIGDKEEN